MIDDHLSHAACQRQLRERLAEIAPPELLPFERLAAIVTADTELRHIAGRGSLGAEGELYELITEYGEHVRDLTR